MTWANTLKGYSLAPSSPLDSVVRVHYTFDMLMAIVREILTFIAGGRECVVCGRRCGALSMCRACKTRIIEEMRPNAAQKRCAVCGKVLLSEQGVCMRCRGEGRILHHSARVLPLSSYRLWRRELLTLWKGRGDRALSPFFAERIASALHDLDDKVIVPVPPRPGKVKSKGWDQIEDICHYLKKDFTILHLLYRTDKKEQKARTGKERIETIDSGIYRAKEGRALRHALRAVEKDVPDRVCLIDDVMTTGSTTESCAIALNGIGIKEVDVVCLFDVD